MIIGIMGFIGTGKSTIAKILREEYGYESASFADGLKDATAAIFNWPRELLEGDTSESRKFRETEDEYWSRELGRKFTPRLALQLMGTEAGRNVFGPSLWVSSCMKRIEDSGHQKWVISDCRFPNEIEAIRKRNGKIIQVNRGISPEWLQTAMESISGMHPINSPEHMVNKYPDVHYSEWAWVTKAPNAIIHNNTDFEDLRRNLGLVMNHFTKPNSEIMIVGSRIDKID